MDSRLYFVLGDIFSNVLAGLVAGWFSWLLVDTGWNMWLAMIVSMVVGMLVAGVMFIPLSIVFGIIELMLPMMFSGMLGGMVVGMWAAMHPGSGGMAAFVGAVCGLVGIVVIWVVNNSLRGVVTVQGDA